MPNLKIVALLCSTLIMQSCCLNNDCDDDTDPGFELVSRYDPVIITRFQLEESVQLLPAREVENSGKIYVIGPFLFINEVNKGFHVFDNSNPSEPRPLNFIETPGATDLAVKDGVYFINQAVDFIAVTYESRSSELIVTKRIREVFPVMLSPDGFFPNELGEDQVVIDWVLKTEN